MTVNRFSEGSAAFYNMMSKPTFKDPVCPYPKGSVEESEWDTGFEDAYEWYFSTGLYSEEESDASN